ncbi:MAG TPA: O-methyltransferase [Planctomycetota bacterium]|nr:O-methyltransferase [Planctomycetota bacterium]
MSDVSTPVTAAHFAYVAARTRGEDAFLRDLRTAAKDAGLPPIHIAPEQASLVQILLKLRGARDVLEVGTLGGYSAIWMARALPEGGRVVTVEASPKHAAFARAWIARSDVARRIEVVEGLGAEALPKLADRSFDALFLDADKAGYAGYLAEARRLLRPRGLVMTDNAFAFGRLFDARATDREVPAVRAFNDHVATLDWLHAVITPIGDGMWTGVVDDPSPPARGGPSPGG